MTGSTVPYSGMTRSRAGAAALLAAAFSLSACGPGTTATDGHPVAPQQPPSGDAVSLVTDTSARGHVAIGCALERGVDRADALTRHYVDAGSHELFRAALETSAGYVIAARLWDASDAVRSQRTHRARARLLEICSTAGFNDRAGLPVLRSYACSLNAELIRERPHIGSFRPESTQAKPGDPRRTDASFIDAAYLLLSIKESPQWLDAGSPGATLDSGNDAGYRAALRHFAALCDKA